MNREMIKLIIGTSSGVLIGGFVGFVVTQRVLKEKYDALLDEEVLRLKEYYRQDDVDEDSEAWNAANEPYDPEELDRMSNEELVKMNEDLQRDLVAKGRNSKIIQELSYSEEDPDVLEVRPEEEHRKMTIEEATPIDPSDEKLQEMIALRTPDTPYVITIDEFMEDYPEDYDKISVTYFDGDGNLSDSRERIIPEVEEIIGSDALTKFGLFSKDKNIVYVRNEKIRTDFEVALDQRSYVEVIAGLRAPQVLKKMREDD